MEADKSHAGNSVAVLLTASAERPQANKVIMEKGGDKLKKNTMHYGRSAYPSAYDLKGPRLSATAAAVSTSVLSKEARNLNTAESVKASKSSKKSFSLKTFMTLKPSWPPKSAIKSQESHESMTSPHSTHSMILLPPSPDLPSEMRRLRNAPKAVHVFKIPTIRPGVKITYEEASREPMDIESYYAVDKLRKFVSTTDYNDHLPILYHKQYNVRILKYGVELRQVLLFDKPARVFSILSRDLPKESNCIKWNAIDISTVYNITDLVPDIIKEHDIRKMAKLMKLKVWKILPPWSDFDVAMLYPLRVQMMGSVVACKLALDKGWAINIGGGFGHYTTNAGGGLSMYDDILVCLAIMSKSLKVKHILIVNFDAYQSLNYKYASYAAISCPVTIIDFYTESIHQPSCDADPKFLFPNTYVFYHSQKMDAGQNVNDYISKLTTIFDRLFGNPREDNPSLCIYVGGTTALADNPHTTMSFTKKGVMERDSAVFQLLHVVNKIPIAILLGGGFHLYDIETAAASVCQLCKSASSLLK